jgi:hypothetical protein
MKELNICKEMTIDRECFEEQKWELANNWGTYM